MRKVKIHWNGFLSKCCKEYPKECCAFLFADKPFSKQEEWFVFPVKNIAENPIDAWIPDKKEMQKVKNKARKAGLTKIGNVHSHPLPTLKNYQDIHDKDTFEIIEEIKHPSETDLKFARKFNDTIRCILVVGSEAVYAQHFHDQYGNTIQIYTEETKVKQANSPENGVSVARFL